MSKQMYVTLPDFNLLTAVFSLVTFVSIALFLSAGQLCRIIEALIFSFNHAEGQEPW